MRQVIINADDYGLSDGICRAIGELFEAKAISSTSVMIAAQGAAERCTLFNVRQFTGRVGAHLQLTNGIPISPSKSIPSLIDSKTGRFRSKPDFSVIEPAEAELEWRAQIGIVSELLGGRLPSHLDTHHGLHHSPTLAPTFVRIASEYGLPVRDRTAMQSFCPKTKVRGSDIVIYEWTAKGRGVGALRSEFRRAMRKARGNDLLELVCHPGHMDQHLSQVSSLNALREKDYEALRLLASQDWLKRKGAGLISFSEASRGM